MATRIIHDAVRLRISNVVDPWISRLCGFEECDPLADRLALAYNVLSCDESPHAIVRGASTAYARQFGVRVDVVVTVKRTCSQAWKEEASFGGVQLALAPARCHVPNAFDASLLVAAAADRLQRYLGL